ncbi:MAG: hypothetical protein M3R11_05960 [Acidobacteriota bacterium]|nr:hypothetical protein [Acidobacteriota bacterium]
MKICDFKFEKGEAAGKGNQQVERATSWDARRKTKLMADGWRLTVE